jgi:glycosyltransferase involved in cell wall biosynthesis|tara:strand:- start:8647 stop:9708 length:1062 start_codon:yes stop_codon:yes gene_type:complete
MSDKLLLLNLSVDSENTSLAFTQTWINELAVYYEEIDVITLRVGEKYKVNKNVKLFSINDKNSNLSKINQLFKLFKITRFLINNNSYQHCFAHMSPLQHLVAKYFLYKKNVKSTLWFTHIGPKFGLKWIILWFSSFLANNIVTASKNSFPFKFNNIIVTGHGILFEKFYNKKVNFIGKKFLVLSRVSKSKNIENTLENFLKIKDFKNSSIDIIGGVLNKNDEDYLNYLKDKYKVHENINFLGKKSHDSLPQIIKNYDISINNTNKGFFDKAVLESISAGNICFYKSEDFNFLYSDSFTNFLLFEDNNLYKKIDLLLLQNNDSIVSEITYSQIEAEKHALNNVVLKLVTIFKTV